MIDDSGLNKDILRKQQCHWEKVFSSNSLKFGDKPSEAALRAIEFFKKEEITKVLELGAGQGRDSLFFARNGLDVHSLDYSREGIECIKQKAQENKLSEHITALQHDVRNPLPFDDETFDACYSHMLFCMPLTISELQFVSKEIRRVLKSGGLNIYTTRHTEDSQYKTGIHRGEGMWEIKGGFIVHFLSKEKIEQLSEGYEVINIEEFEEGLLPRKLFSVFLRKKS